jgi:hypothetical protein
LRLPSLTLLLHAHERAVLYAALDGGTLAGGEELPK